MSCIGCICEHCANSAECFDHCQGEMDEPCYNCEDCIHWDGKVGKEMAVRGGVSRITATVHVYRKTFASVLYRKTGDVLLVSKLLGHAKPDMTV